MILEIKNCNNIDYGKISLHPNTLNIKYGINGTGKTTITRAIEYSINEKDLKKLIQFKSIVSQNEEDFPQLSGLEDIQTIAIFNENYINNYVFVEDEIIKGSFEIFIRDEHYIDNAKAIHQITSIIYESVNQNPIFDELIRNLEELVRCFGNSQGKIAKNSDLFKAVGAAHNIYNIPESLLEYSPFIKSEKNTKWLKWQLEGNHFGEDSEVCPYCTSDIKPKKEIILSVKNEYDNKKIEKLNKILNTVEELKEYIAESVYEKIINVCRSIDGLSELDEMFLVNIKIQVQALVEQIKAIKNYGSRPIASVKTVESELKHLLIDMNNFGVLNSEKMLKEIMIINQIIEDILSKIGKVKGVVAKQESHVKKTIESHKTDINSFLESAGYSYSIDVIESSDEFKIVLKHNDFTSEFINDAKSHLSFGEKNAFALVLFMFEAIKNNVDLIVLDDPISSFDKNKKFAIINRLFKGKNSFQDRTVLMLTHDFDPIVDMLYNVESQFKNYPKKAYFLENKLGVLSEKEIKKENIKTFFYIAEKNMEECDSIINKMIYLRRLYELQENESNAYQVLSNILHKRETPIIKSNEGNRDMNDEEIKMGIVDIQKVIPEFTSYKDVFTITSNTEYLIAQYESAMSNYEKLQIYRMLDKNAEDNVIRKFVNETYHLENDYLYQLNPREYSTIPQYIIDVCDREIVSKKLQLV